MQVTLKAQQEEEECRIKEHLPNPYGTESRDCKDRIKIPYKKIYT